MALVGKLPPAEVMVLAVIVFPSFPEVLLDEKKIVAEPVEVSEPSMVQFCMS